MPLRIDQRQNLRWPIIVGIACTVVAALVVLMLLFDRERQATVSLDAAARDTTSSGRDLSAADVVTSIHGQVLPKQGWSSIDLVEAAEGELFPMSVLQPEFRIPVDPGVAIEDLEFYLDNSQNILADPLLRDMVNATMDSGYLAVRPQFSLFPGLHEITAVVSTNGSMRVIRKRILLAYADDFSSDSQLKRLWTTSDEWYVTDDRKLKGNIGEDKIISTIAFRRDFANDVLIEFDFIPLSDAVNVAVFFGEGFSFFIGDGDNVTVRLRKVRKLPSGRKSQVYLVSKRLPFRLEKNTSYRARVTRIGDRYSLFMSREPELLLEEPYIIFAVTDQEPETKVVERFHTVGLAVWKGSGKATTTGAMFDNIVMYEPHHLDHSSP